MINLKKAAISAGVVAAVATTGVVVAATSDPVTTTGAGGDGAASLSCPGGMTRLGHPFDEDMSIFPFDPAIHVETLYTVADDFFKVEDIDMGAHAGTHIDVPAHFIGEAGDINGNDGRSLDQMDADDFVWPVYKIDVSDLALDLEEGQLQLTMDDIEDYEDEYGIIPSGSLVVLQTGAEEFFGLDGPGDEYRLARKNGGNGGGKGRILEPHLADNVDDLFDFANAGFSGDAIDSLFADRGIAGVGSDAYGPDAADDADFLATYNTLYNNGVALVALANLDSVAVNGDIIMAPAVNLTDGSGFSVDPLACHGSLES